MHWNHRVVRFKSEEEPYLAICEAFYEDDGKVMAHTADGVIVSGSSIEEIREELERMLACLDKPIIDQL